MCVNSIIFFDFYLWGGGGGMDWSVLMGVVFEIVVVEGNSICLIIFSSSVGDIYGVCNVLV